MTTTKGCCDCFASKWRWNDQAISLTAPHFVMERANPAQFNSQTKGDRLFRWF